MLEGDDIVVLAVRDDRGHPDLRAPRRGVEVVEVVAGAFERLHDTLVASGRETDALEVEGARGAFEVAAHFERGGVEGARLLELGTTPSAAHLLEPRFADGPLGLRVHAFEEGREAAEDHRAIEWIVMPLPPVVAVAAREAESHGLAPIRVATEEHQGTDFGPGRGDLEGGTGAEGDAEDSRRDICRVIGLFQERGQRARGVGAEPGSHELLSEVREKGAEHERPGVRQHAAEAIEARVGGPEIVQAW